MATILIVEDEAAIRAFVALVLTEAGHRVLEAGNGARALELAQAEHPDLIFTDILMPGMDGYEFARRLRALGGRRPRILFCTGVYHQEAARALAQACGVAPLVLPKPVGKATLLRTVTALLQSAPSEDVASAVEFERRHVRLLNDTLFGKVRELEAVNARVRAMFEMASVGIGQADPRSGRMLLCNDKLCAITGYSREELLAKPVWELTHPEDRDADWALYQRAARGELPQYINEKRYVRKDGSVVWVRVNCGFIRDEHGEAVLTAAVVEDITQRKLSEQKLQESYKRLEVLREIDRAILAAQSTSQIVAETLSRIRTLVPCERASVKLFDAASQEAVVLAVDGSGALKLVGGARLPLALLGDLEDLRQGKVRVVADMAEPGCARPITPLLLAEGVRSCVTAPLLAEDNLIGALSLSAAHPRAFTTEQALIAGEAAASLAVAIQQGRLFEQLQSSRERLQALSRRLLEVQEAERRWVARELHDEIGQMLTALQFSLDRSPVAVADRCPAWLGEARGLVQELLARVREMSRDLRPTMLDELGLLPTLLWYCERYTPRTGVRVVLQQTRVERRFAPELETAVYRIVQEALTNVARHAGVIEAIVRLWADAETLHAQIEDEGDGFDPQAVEAGGSSGLAGMRERAVLLGGELTIDAAPRTGTRVTAALPLTRQ
jgi:PAS domain S-box-containing protein